MKTPAELLNYVERLRQGDNDAFKDVYEGSYKYLHTCVMHIVKDEDAAQDMLQEAYVEIFKGIHSLKSSEDFLSWAATIANRKCFAYIKKDRDLLVDEQTDDEGKSNDFFESLADDESFIPENILDNRAKIEMIRGIIDDLSDVQRACVIGYYYNEQKQEEIAGQLGIPVNTVKSHLSRAKSKIREAVGDVEKKQGVKLYSFAGLMLFLFGFEVKSYAAEGTVPAMSAELYSLYSKGVAAGAKAVSVPVSQTEKMAATNSGIDNISVTAYETDRVTSSTAGKLAAETAATTAKTRLLVPIVAGVVTLGAATAALTGVLPDRSNDQDSTQQIVSLENSEGSENQNLDEQNEGGEGTATDEESGTDGMSFAETDGDADEGGEDYTNVQISARDAFLQYADSFDLIQGTESDYLTVETSTGYEEDYSNVRLGCIGYMIDDFDNDNEDEMLAAELTEPTKIVFSMYEYDGDVKLADRFELEDYYLSGDANRTFSFVYDNGDYKNICYFSNGLAYYIADGTFFGLEVLSYRDGRFEDIGAAGYAGSDLEEDDYFMQTVEKCGLGVTWEDLLDDPEKMLLKKTKSDWFFKIVVSTGVVEYPGDEYIGMPTRLERHAEFYGTAAHGGSSDSDDYIISKSSYEYLTESDLSGLSNEELRIARNEILARHGRRFNDEELQEYFNNRSWYKGTIEPDKFDSEVHLSKVEEYNIQFLKEHEQ